MSVRGIILTFYLFVVSVSTSPLINREALPVTPTAAGEEYRLPGNVEPTHYEILLKPNLDPDTDFKFEGEVTITLKVVSDTNTVIFHVDDIEVTSVTLTKVDSNSVESDVVITNEDTNTTLNFYILTLENEILSGEEYKLNVKYNGYHRDDMRGFYRSSYVNSEGKKVWLASTHFEPVRARRAFPCFDEPAMKAKFLVKILHLPEFTTVLTNMPISTSVEQDGKILTTFQETPMPMSTYLVAFVVSEFEGTSEDYVTVYHRPGISSQATYSASIGPATIKVMEDFTGVKYTLPKMDEIAVPDFSAGAMENYAIVTYRERMILFEEGISSSAYKQSIATVIAHEFAHQWFGDLVGPRWWKYLWLNEGFATYFEFLATAKVETDWRLDEQFVVREVHNALSADSSLSSHPMTYDVYTPTAIGNIFDSISYDKAGSVLRMIEHFLGLETFKKGLNRYLQAHADNTAEDTDLFNGLIEQYKEDNQNSDLDLESVLISWARQAGYPVITVTRNYDTGSVTVSQIRFLLSGVEDTETTWWVPLTYTASSEMSFTDTSTKLWLQQNEKQKSLPITLKNDEFIILNILQTGFYRVMYDSVTWDQIIDYLNYADFTKIPPVNRAQLINDAFTFARAISLKYSAAFKLANYLRRETDYIPWYAALSALSYVNTRFNGLPSSEYDVFKQHVLGLLDKVYNELGFDQKDTDDHVTKLHRNQILTWACNLGHEGCIKAANEKFNAFVNNPTENYVEPDLQTVVYCNGLRNRLDTQSWNLLWNKFTTSQVSTEQVLILGILGCTGNETLAHEYLFKYVRRDEDIRSQDISVVLSSITNNRNEKFLISFINTNYDQIVSIGGVSSVRSLISTASSSISSQELYDQLAKFVDDHATELGGDSTALLSSARSNIQWAQTNKDEVLEFIRETNYRLPDHLVPVSYTLKLTPEFVDFTFDGEVSILVKAEKATNIIHLHASDMKISEAGTQVQLFSDENPLKILSQTENTLLEFYIIELEENLIAGEQYTIFIKYTGNMRDDMYGFYRSSYKVGNDIRWIGTTQFEPTSARRAFPCFDEPALKATFDISIARPTGFTSISNTEKISENVIHSEKENYEWDHFALTPPMSTYLVAFVVSEFVPVSNEHNNISIWQREEAKDQAQYSISISQDILSHLEEYTGIDFELTKMDQAAIPDFSAGAMENWGLVTYRERLILFDEKVSTTSNKQSIATVITHEFAHQWFGDLVSPAWWKFLWLNEGFATYFEYFGTAQVEKDWRLEEQFVVRELQGALSSDALDSSHPMSHDVMTPAEISSIFDSISYSKAGAVIRMTKHCLSEETFRKGLNRYLNSRIHEHAEEDHLLTAWHDQHLEDVIEEPARVDVTSILKTWTSQKGYPLITVQRNYVNNQATVSQKRFLLKENTESPDQHVYRWHVPLTYTAKSNLDFSRTSPNQWLQETDEQITISNIASPNDWVIFNIQETGYYRVNYDNSNWNLIIEHLNGDNYKDIHVLNRAQLLDDGLTLARAGVLDYSIALSLTKYLEKEDDYIPWYPAFNALSFLNIRLSGAEAQEYQLYKDYVLRLISNLYNTLGFDNRPNDSHTTKLLRMNVLSWACSYGLTDCITTAREKFAQFKSNPQTNQLNPDASSVIYCTALQYGTQDDWDFLWNKFETSNVGTEQVLLISALGCPSNVNTINSYLQRSITENSGIRRQDAASVFSAVYTNAQGLEMAFNFLTQNYESISEFYGGMNSIASILTGIASRLSNRDQYNKLKEFVDANEGKLGNALAASRRALETVEENIGWLDKHHDAIISWLRETVDGTTEPGPSTTEQEPSTTEARPPSPVTDPSTTPGSGTTLTINYVLLAISVVMLLIKM